MKHAFSLIALFAAIPALAQETRQLDAHEHGVGELNIAIDGKAVVMEFHAPGADIVGFEYEAESDADLAAIEAALITLSAPLGLFVIPDAAACTVLDAHAELEGAEHHGEHDEHEEHDEEEHEEHHGDEDHDEHAEEPGHTEFHAEYALTCENPDALTEISFDYFEAFPNAIEVEVQFLTNLGARSFEVGHDSPDLDFDR